MMRLAVVVLGTQKSLYCVVEPVGRPATFVADLDSRLPHPRGISLKNRIDVPRRHTTRERQHHRCAPVDGNLDEFAGLDRLLSDLHKRPFKRKAIEVHRFSFSITWITPAPDSYPRNFVGACEFPII